MVKIAGWFGPHRVLLGEVNKRQHLAPYSECGHLCARRMFSFPFCLNYCQYSEFDINVELQI